MLFFKISQYHRKAPVLESPFNKIAGVNACNLIKKRLQHRRFPVNIAKCFKGDLRPKRHSYFYDIFLLILLRKNHVQNFAVFWSVLTKLWTCKILNLTYVTSYTWKHKTFYPWFSFHIFVKFMENELSIKFYGVFHHFSGNY